MSEAAAPPRYRSFEEFWPFYLSQHSRPWTRRLHFAGTSGGLVCLAAGIATRPWWIAAAPVFAYGLAWFSHFFIERNRPATFSYPWWSLRGDFRMLGRMLTGGGVSPEKP